LAFSTIDRDSYTAVQKWHKKVLEQCGQIPTILVQTKLDLEGTQAKVSENEGKELSDLLNITLFRVSSKQDLRIKELFEYLANTFNKSKNQKIVEEKETKEQQQVQVVKEAKELKLGEIKKDNKKKEKTKAKKQEDQVTANEKQNEVIRKNLNDEKKKNKCCIF